MGGWILAITVLFTGPACAAGQEMDVHNAARKLGRGGVNLFTGWVEIVKRIRETSAEDGALAGWTWGLVRGIGYGFIRTAGGAYEVVTFPFPAPPGYRPVMEPEFVFDDDATDVEDDGHSDDSRF